jgi:hypothetical protein
MSRIDELLASIRIEEALELERTIGFGALPPVMRQAELLASIRGDEMPAECLLDALAYVGKSTLPVPMIDKVDYFPNDQST